MRAVAAAVLACVAAGCAAPASPSRVTSVDVLDYVIGDPNVWPRRGNLSQNQVVDFVRREVCWPKHVNPRFFECWRWDDQFIYHEVDHGVDGNTGESYRFADGRWLPRHLDGEWRLDVTTDIVWFDPACHVNPAKSGPFRYHQRAWIERGRDAGGDIGVRDVLVLEYAPEDPAGGPTAAEHFYFARGAGWYAWTRSDAERRFNLIGGPSVPIVRDVICP